MLSWLQAMVNEVDVFTAFATSTRPTTRLAVAVIAAGGSAVPGATAYPASTR
jgi:hypothetical protein